THNLYFGNMQKWSDYYKKLFNFREIRYFDIKGAKTGLLSKAMTAPDGMVRIPLNESSDPKSQINEYLDTYQGEGIQHIACFTDDIYTTVEKMREAGIEFLDTPDTYFDVIDQRIPDHGEDLALLGPPATYLAGGEQRSPGHGEGLARLARHRLLIRADPEHQRRPLVHILRTRRLGPILSDIIRRKGHGLFRGGNFQALFESI